jgi:hypothetical protein
MTRKLLVLALALTASVLLTTNVFGQACSTGAVFQYNAVGSSAQFNTNAYAAGELLTAQAGDTGLNAGDYNLISGNKNLASGNIVIHDERMASLGTGGVNLDDSATVWVMWDNNNTCNVYAYWSVDSTVGVKDYFAYQKYTAATGHVYNVAGAVGNVGTGVTSASKVGGLADNAAALPPNVLSLINNPVLPIYTTKLLNHQPEYCGSILNSDGTYKSGGYWCYFNAAPTDIRPEDALYATTRALSSYSTTNGLAGLGYNQSACLAGTNGTTAANQGCPILDSFGGGKYFNVLNFKLSGTDPITAATLPTYTTISAGASPMVVFVSNNDATDALGFGKVSGSSYVFTNINRGVLSQVYNGTLHCTGDLQSNFPGVGKPIQVVNREPLSGTYNTFEFTAVRTLGGSLPAAVKESAVSTKQWVSNDDAGQEYNNNPVTGFGTSACGGSVVLNAGLTSAPTAGSSCGDPMFIETGSSGKACGTGLRLRAIGTGQEVPAATSQSNKGGSVVTNGIGYAFWSYGNFAPAVVSGSCTIVGGQYTTCTNLGHYLTVDDIDPLFATAGGALDSAPNPNGAYNLPQCDFASLATGQDCFKIPFTHMLDGSYPLWSLLRTVTFLNKTSTSATPPGVLNVAAFAQNEASINDRTSDFVPFLSSLVNTSGSYTAPTWTGNLNLGVYRSHYFQSAINPDNGHDGCPTNFVGIALVGGTSGVPTCLIDAGGDEGGTVYTVQSDVDFNSDFGGVGTNPMGMYGQRQ